MKIMILVLALLLLTSCSQLDDAVSSENNGSSPTPIPASAIPDEAQRAAAEQRKDVETRSDAFKRVPDEFKQVDFTNFKYPVAQLINGEYRSSDAEPNASGRQTAALRSVFYVDVFGDNKKEAIVDISFVACGGSCDGGSDIFYIYSANRPSPKLQWKFQTGTIKYGCGLKSFVLKNKTIAVEMFGDCEYDKGGMNPSNDTVGPFIFSDTTRVEFQSNGKTFFKTALELLPEKPRSVNNYQPKIDVSN
jgi:hypothetical protein